MTKFEGPFQLDCAQGRLKASNGFKTARLPSKFFSVLQAMLETDSGRYQSIKTSLSYSEVATHYAKGLIEDSPSEKNAERLKLKKATNAEEIDKYLKKQAQQFKRGFRVWLKRWNIEIDDIVVCDRRDEAYRLGKSWGEPPKIYASESSVFTTDHSTLESLSAPKTGKTKIRSPDHEDSEE